MVQHMNRKRVTFNAVTETFYRAGSTAKVNSADLWYSAEDKAACLDDCKKNLTKFIQKGGDVAALNDKKYCLRGLEELHDPAHPKKVTNLRKFILRILELQHEQRTYGITDPEELMIYSVQFSQTACIYAHKMACQDFSAAQTIADKSEKPYKNISISRWFSKKLPSAENHFKLPSSKPFASEIVTTKQKTSYAIPA